MSEKIFTKGIIFKSPRQGAPSFIKGSLSFKADEFIVWLQENTTPRGWVNVDVKESKGGKLYCELNTYQRGQQSEHSEEPRPDNGEEIATEDIPF